MAPGDKDVYGRTQLCNAVGLSDVTAVQTQLNLGADPNGECSGSTLVHFIVLNAQLSGASARRSILQLLLSAGAKVTAADLKTCRNPDNGPVCAREFLPILPP
jgi:hypothetical protein